MKKKLIDWWTGGGYDRALLTNLISYWKLDGNANDSKGSNNGTLNGSPSSVTGIINNGYQFNGTSQYIKIADAANLSFGNAGTDTAMSISLWYKPSTFAVNQRIFNKRDTTPTYEWELSADTSGRVSLTLFSAGAATATLGARSNAGLSTGSFHHIVVTYSGSKTFAGMKIYYNGVSQTITETSTNSYAGMNNTVAPLNIAAVNDTAALTGVLDEIGIWNKELSASNVLALYNNGSGLAYGSFL